MDLEKIDHETNTKVESFNELIITESQSGSLVTFSLFSHIRLS